MVLGSIIPFRVTNELISEDMYNYLHQLNILVSADIGTEIVYNGHIIYVYYRYPGRVVVVETDIPTYSVKSAR